MEGKNNKQLDKSVVEEEYKVAKLGHVQYSMLALMDSFIPTRSNGSSEPSCQPCPQRIETAKEDIIACISYASKK
jgi:hypothetical protein